MNQLEPAETVERTRQQRDPAGTTVVRIFTCAIVAGAALSAIVATLLRVHELVTPICAIVSLVMLLAAVILVFRQTSPYNIPLGRDAFLLIIGLVVVGYFFFIAATLGHNRFGRDDWGPSVLGVFLLAFGPYRPAREIAFVGGALASFVGLGTIIQVRWFETIAPPDAFVLVSVSPLIAFCFGAVAYSRGMVLSIERWQRRANVAIRDGGGVSVGIARSVQQDRVTILGQDVLPFFSAVVASGLITDADRVRAREIAGSVRDVMVAEADRSWLETAVMMMGATGPRADSASIDDPERLAAGMTTAQRMALRALLGAFVQDSGSEPDDLRIELSRDGDLCAADLFARFAPTQSSQRAAFAPYFALLHSVFDDFEVDFDHPSLRIRFHYEQS